MDEQQTEVTEAPQASEEQQATSEPIDNQTDDTGQEQEVQGQSEPEWFQKRIGKLTAQKKSAQEDNVELRSRIAQLEAQQAQGNEPKEKQYTDTEILAAIKNAAEEGAWDDHAALQEHLINKRVIEKEQQFIDKQEKQDRATKKQNQEWAKLTDKYGKYGLSDVNSDFYKLASAHYKNDPAGGMTSAVANTFLEMQEHGELTTPQLDNTKLQLKKERMRNQLGSGVSSGESEAPTKEKTSEEFNKDAIQRMIAQHAKMTGGVS